MISLDPLSEVLNSLTSLIPGCAGVASNGDGTYRVDFDGQPSRLATSQEILSAKKLFRIAAIRAEARQRIEAVYPDWRQRSAALGLYPAEYVSTMQAAIASVIAASNAGEDSVDAAADVAAVEAVTVTWPVI